MPPNPLPSIVWCCPVLPRCCCANCPSSWGLHTFVTGCSGAATSGPDSSTSASCPRGSRTNFHVGARRLKVSSACGWEALHGQPLPYTARRWALVRVMADGTGAGEEKVRVRRRAPGKGPLSPAACGDKAVAGTPIGRPASPCADFVPRPHLPSAGCGFLGRCDAVGPLWPLGGRVWGEREAGESRLCELSSVGRRQRQGSTCAHGLAHFERAGVVRWH